MIRMPSLPSRGFWGLFGRFLGAGGHKLKGFARWFLEHARREGFR